MPKYIWHFIFLDGPKNELKLFRRFRSVSIEIFDHSYRSALVRSDTDVGQEGLLFFIPKLWVEIRTVQVSQVLSCFLKLCSRTLEQEGAIPLIFLQSGQHETVQNVLVFDCIHLWPWK